MRPVSTILAAVTASLALSTSALAQAAQPAPPPAAEPTKGIEEIIVGKVKELAGGLE